LGDLVGHGEVILLKDADVQKVERAELVIDWGGGEGNRVGLGRFLFLRLGGFVGREGEDG
jgi:hypothetical protein